MTIFGVPLVDLDRTRLQTFLDQAESEPLLWEAKGTVLDAREVRRAICGFANGLEPGYLILGADQRDGEWVLEGIEMNDEPPLWISNVIRGGVRPEPRYEVHVVDTLASGRRIVVVEVLPIAVPPCFSRGTVFERVPGATPSVKDPIRLAELYGRGQAANDAAWRGVRTHSQDLIKHRPEGVGPNTLAVTLALAARSYPADKHRMVFTEQFAHRLDSAFDEVMDVPPNLPISVPRSLLSRQSGVIVRGLDQGFARGFSRFVWVQATWDGVATIHYQSGMDAILAKELAPVSIRRSWLAAIELVKQLGGRGRANLRIDIDGGLALRAPDSRLPLHAELERGPLELEFDQEQLDDIDRELRRAAGEVVFESESGPAS